MAESKYDLILHPVRLQILHALEGDRRMTVPQLESRLPDLQPAEILRQVEVLVRGGMLVVAESSPEPVYRVGEAEIPAYDKYRATPADHLRYFTTFVAGLIDAFSRYVKRPGADIVRDRVTYRQRTLFLTDQELATLLDDLEARFNSEEDDPADRDRKPHVVTWIVLPEVQPRDKT